MNAILLAAKCESFEADLDIKDVGRRFPAVFIRAPHIVEAGENVEILAKHNDRIVAAREGQYPWLFLPSRINR